jgi:FAD/FMN-containing dehydrogenase
MIYARPLNPIIELARQLAGKVVTDQPPALIVECFHAMDVAVCVEFARAQGLPLAIGGGSDPGAALGDSHRSLVIDLSAMKEIRVDADERTVTAGAGCLPREVEAAAAKAGLTLCRRGLAVGNFELTLDSPGQMLDNLLEADVVQADGSFVRASAVESPDLFRALRRGGNFGVATRLKYRLHKDRSQYPEPVAEGIAVGAADGDLFPIHDQLMDFDHADMPDGHHV